MGLLPRRKVSESQVSPSVLSDFPHPKLTMVMEFKFVTDNRPQIPGYKLKEAPEQIKNRAYGLTAGSHPFVACLAPVFWVLKVSVSLRSAVAGSLPKN